MIWIVGQAGMLGRELGEVLDVAGMPWVGSDREVDITSPTAIEAFARGKAPLWIVNCAAYTAVDKAESEPELAKALNADGAGNLAALASTLGARFLHLSTDYVFGGKGSKPYDEADPIDPIGVYARTKAEGEAAVLGACRQAYILRTAWLYGRHGPNFVKTMLRLMGERERITVVSDQRGTPTYARDLAEAIAAIIRSGADAFGTYHYTNEGETTWYGFASAIRDEALALGLLARDCEVAAVSSSEYQTAAKRPAYSILSKAKIKAVFGIDPPEWRGSLKRYLAIASAEARRTSAEP